MQNLPGDVNPGDPENNARNLTGRQKYTSLDSSHINIK